MREIARSLAAELGAGTQGTAAGGDALDVQAQAVGVQADELTAAYRRWAARGRRPGTVRSLVEGEVATMLLTTAIFAEMAGIGIDQAIGRQVTVTLSAAADPAGTSTGRGREVPREPVKYPQDHPVDALRANPHRAIPRRGPLPSRALSRVADGELVVPGRDRSCA